MEKNTFDHVIDTEKGAFNNLNWKLTLGIVSVAVIATLSHLAIRYWIPPFENSGVVPLVAVLFTLLLMVVLVVKPASKKVKQVLLDLVESEFKANQYAQEVGALNRNLNKMNKDIRDITFALEEATILVKTDAKGIITYANDKYADITKYTRGELVGEKLFMNRLGGEESVVYTHIKNKDKNTEVWKGEVWDHAKDQSGFWLDVTLIPIFNDEGQLYQYLVICSNITMRKNAQEELEKITKRRFENQLNEQKIRSLSIIAGQEKERKRMAREIHDGLGQMLTALKFSLESINVKNDQADNRLQEGKSFLQNIMQEVRRISSDLLPTVLSDFGLVPALNEVAESLNHTTNIQIKVEDELQLERRLNKSYEISLYRIAQEAMNNALKYSQAKQIIIKLTSDAEFLNLSIKDDGIGFVPERELTKGTVKESGNGLKSMRERAELIRGEFLLNSAPGKGTMVYVEVPLDLNEDESN